MDYYYARIKELFINIHRGDSHGSEHVAYVEFRDKAGEDIVIAALEKSNILFHEDT